MLGMSKPKPAPEPKPKPPTLAELEQKLKQATSDVQQAQKLLASTQADHAERVEKAKKRFNTDGDDAAADELLAVERRAELFIGRATQAVIDAQAVQTQAMAAVRRHKLADLEHRGSLEYVSHQVEQLWAIKAKPALEALAEVADSIEQMIRDGHQATLEADKLRDPDDQLGPEIASYRARSVQTARAGVRKWVLEQLGDQRRTELLKLITP